MPDIFALLSQYVHYFPLVALAGLILAGLNLPLSEDLIIITAALISHEQPSLIPYNLAAIYFGVISTDFLVYWVGTRVRKGTSKSRFFTRLIPEKALDKMHLFLNKLGIFAFIIARFIPFGFRNTFFFTTGFFGVRLKFFAIYDITAAMISMNTLFFLTYHFGDAAKRPLKIAGIVLFFAVISAAVSMIIRLFVNWRKNRSRKTQEAGVQNPDCTQV